MRNYSKSNRSEFSAASRNANGKAFLYAAHISMLIRMTGDHEFMVNFSASRRELAMDLLEYGLMESNEYRAVTTSKKGIDFLSDLCLKANELASIPSEAKNVETQNG